MSRGLFRGLGAPILTVVPQWAALYTGYRAGLEMAPSSNYLGNAAFGGACAAAACSAI